MATNLLSLTATVILTFHTSLSFYPTFSTLDHIVLDIVWSTCNMWALDANSEQHNTSSKERDIDHPKVDFYSTMILILCH